MKIAIIDYGAGNIQSIKFAIKRLGYEAILTKNIETIRGADKVIFPGVGEASSAMMKLIDSGLHTLIPSLTQPVLGICLGMQLMCKFSEEGKTQGLGIFEVDVVRFPGTLKVRQIGWNTINQLQTPLFSEIAENEYMYLVHSFYAALCPSTIATVPYGFPYSAALQVDNFYGVQFHPEKSSDAGIQLLSNFLKL